MCKSQQSSPTFSGFTLLDVLISIVLVSIGLLGAMKLEASGLEATRQALDAGIALDLAQELASIMQDQTDLLSTAAFSDRPLLDIHKQSISDTNGITSLCQTSQCSAPAHLARDLDTWQHSLNEQLPDARVMVCRDNLRSPSINSAWQCAADEPGPSTTVVIKVGWAQHQNLSTGPQVILPIYPNPR